LVLEVDIRKYFDSIPIAQLREFLNQRVTDGVVRRMIDKWLKAGVLEQGRCSTRDRDAARGVISPRFLTSFCIMWWTYGLPERSNSMTKSSGTATDFA